MILCRGEVIMVKDERKVITIRVSPELKFAIDKAAVKDNRTINSWVINLIKQNLETEKNRVQK
jgi:predicted HicB family RNase H-like nuclease